MGILVIVFVVVAAISACVVYLALRNRRGSGEGSRFEPGQQGAPLSPEAGMNEAGYRSQSGSGL